ncbi:MAG: hypothetical protein JOZ81_28490 [Chloroflexi bacterium]|nr:hypothetical protein [Chloroflexota bacterium]
MRRVLWVGLLPTVAALAVLVAGVQLAPADERGDLGADRPLQSSIEFVGRSEQVGSSETHFGYVTHIAGVDDGELFSDPNPAARNETTAHLSFFATTTVEQNFMVLPPPAVPSLFDVDSSGMLTFYFSETPPARSFATPASFATGVAVAANTVRLQDVVAALVGVDPSRGVIDGDGELCQRSSTPFRLGGEVRRLGHEGLLQKFSSHGWTVRTSPSPPQSFTHFGGHTTPVGDARC